MPSRAHIVSASLSRLCSASAESCGSTKRYISTFSNWWTRFMPRVSRPAAAFSRRKQGVWATYFNGRVSGCSISSRCMFVIAISAVGSSHRSSSSSRYMVSANLGRLLLAVADSVVAMLGR